MKTIGYLSAILTVLLVPAWSDEVMFGPDATNVYFCSGGTGGSGAVNVTMTGDSTCATSTSVNLGNTNSSFFVNSVKVLDNQQWSLTTFGPLILVPMAPAPTIPFEFSTSGTSSFTFGTNASDQLTGTITWNQVDDNTLQPKFIGNLAITSATGVLASSYTPGSTAGVTMILDTGSTIDSLATSPTARSTSGHLSTAEIPAVPETSSVVLLGTGMLVAGAFLRFRRGRLAARA